MDELLSPAGGSTIENENAATSTVNLVDLRSKLDSGTEKVQLQAIADLTHHGQAGLAVLQAYLLAKLPANPATPIEGKIYGILRQSDSSEQINWLQTHFPTGILPLQSQAGIDYAPLQQLLAEQKFEAGDRLTVENLCQLAGPAAVRRKWLYFTEVDDLPIQDLQTIDQLWMLHSEGKFGYSVQRQLWLGVQQNWDALWPKIGWREGKKWTRYPQEFIWDLTAPKGHLPLTNQLRGVQLMSALLNHPAWS
jgi:GUN4-like/ARM-like repeat domain, GUN4-N terminal